MKAVLVSAIVLLLVSALMAQTAPTANKEASKPTDPELQALKQVVAAQQAQIQVLSQELHQTNQQLQQTNEQLQQAQRQVQQVQTTAADAVAKADAAQIKATQQQQSVSALSTDVADLKLVNHATSDPVLRNAGLTVQDYSQTPQTATEEQPQVLNKEMESPITIRFRGINITPGGFAAAETVYRTRALGADLTTPFNSLTVPGASQSTMPEFYGSARQSRPTVFVESRLKNVDLSSYVSGDFLSAGVTSTSTQTDSYTFRLRQAWGQAKFDNGWSFLGGQMWSLLTENLAGIAPSDDTGRTNDARPRTIDPQYSVGFTFARQLGIRLTKKFGDAVSAAVAIENPQATLSTHENASNFLLGEPGASNSYNTTYNYSFNPMPDIIGKIAFDPGFGHYEIYGLVDRFNDRVFPCVESFASAACGSLTAPSAFGAYTTSKNGGGVGASARWTVADKHIVFGVKGLGGSGIGRYGAGQLADASINGDGTIHMIKNLQGLTTLEWHSKRLDLYAYGGAEYDARAYSFDPLLNSGKGGEVGYGAPKFKNTGCYSEPVPGAGGFTPGTLADCTADTRALIEATFGFWYRFYTGPRGRFQYGVQYSYLTRNTWSGVGGSPNGLDNMVYSSFRYYLP
jgi:hypothetical protein